MTSVMSLYRIFSFSRNNVFLIEATIAIEAGHSYLFVKLTLVT